MLDISGEGNFIILILISPVNILFINSKCSEKVNVLNGEFFAIFNLIFLQLTLFSFIILG